MSEPAITVHAYHDDGPANLPPTRVVIHATCPPNVPYPKASASGQAHSTAEYFTEAASGGSAHYVVDVAHEEHCVADSHIAWHAPPNAHSLGIEICGQSTYTRAQWLAPDVWPAVVLAARRTADLCSRYGIPAVRITTSDLLHGSHGVCGHVDVSEAWHESTHTDPGPGFPWPEFMAAVLAGGAGSGAGPIAPNTHTEDYVSAYDWPSGDVAKKLVVPVGKASALVSHGWLSLACDGVVTHYDVWFQSDTGGIGELHGSLKKDERGNWLIPDGNTQIVIHYSATGPVGCTLELAPK